MPNLETDHCPKVNEEQAAGKLEWPEASRYRERIGVGGAGEGGVGG